jgi:tetratricopeptide (TPR) repeat protein
LVAASGRLLLIRLESRGSRICVALLTLALAAGLGRGILEPAVADYLVWRAPTVAGFERALAWDPHNPDLHLRLGQAYEAESSLPAVDHGRARRHFETALRLRPASSVPWLQLALLAEREGDRGRAHDALDAALRADPHNVKLRWEAALLALRWGERDQALGHLRYVLGVDPAERDAAFQLARALIEPGEDPGSLLPSEPNGLTSVLTAAVEHEDLPLAEVAWARRAPLPPTLPERLSRQYLELVLANGEGTAARSAWPSLVHRDRPTVDGNLVWNGGFEAERLLGWGLDWRVQRVWGVEVGLDRFVVAKGRRSLRLKFNSFPKLDFAGVWQFVPVEPGRQYRLRALAKALDFETRSGLKLQVALPEGEVLAETAAVSRTTDDWVPLEATVPVPAQVSLVVLRLRREPAVVPEGNLGGKIWVDEVSLE